MNIKKEIELHLDNDETLYTAAEKLASLSKPTLEQYNDLAETALSKVAGDSGTEYNDGNLATALEVVKNWVKEEKTNQ